MRRSSKKKNAKLKKGHAARPKNKQFEPNKNKKDLNEKSKIVQRLNRKSALNATKV